MPFSNLYSVFFRSLDWFDPVVAFVISDTSADVTCDLGWIAAKVPLAGHALR